MSIFIKEHIGVGFVFKGIIKRPEMIVDDDIYNNLVSKLKNKTDAMYTAIPMENVSPGDVFYVADVGFKIDADQSFTGEEIDIPYGGIIIAMKPSEWFLLDAITPEMLEENVEEDYDVSDDEEERDEMMNFYIPNIEFTVETFVSDKSNDHKKMVYIAANDGSSGAEYPYETAEDISRALQTYIETYYGDKI